MTSSIPLPLEDRRSIGRDRDLSSPPTRRGHATPRRSLVPHVHRDRASRVAAYRRLREVLEVLSARAFRTAARISWLSSSSSSESLRRVRLCRSIRLARSRMRLCSSFFSFFGMSTLTEVRGIVPRVAYLSYSRPVHNQQLAATLRRFDSSRRRLQKSQRTLERSEARLAAAGAAIDRSIDTLVMCEMAHDVCPATHFSISSWSCGPFSLKADPL
jgi:hypothetical protein